MRVFANRQCLVCAATKVQLWTLDNLSTAGAMYLCKEHGEPLQNLLELAGDLPPEEQVPVPLRDLLGENPILGPGRQRTKMVPLTDWTPPEEESKAAG